MSRIFQLQPDPLVAGDPSWGHVAVIPWDSECFGFPVGTYLAERAGEDTPPPAADVRAHLDAWMAAHQVELVACMVPGGSRRWMACLSAAGFAFVETALLAFARRLSTLPPPRVAVRPAVADDHPALLALAGSAFSFGRYHTDARFPRELADARYRLWMHNALTGDPARDIVLATGAAGQPTGFVCATLDGHRATLALAAVDRDANPGILGPLLMVSAMHALADRGARSVQVRIAAANTAILSLYAGLGFSFPDAEAVYHLHAPGATHLGPIR